ncbi:hypothetical protein Tco_1480101 [Tanacetum coccineum]
MNSPPNYDHVRETTTTTTTQNPVIDNLEEKLVRIIPDPTGIVQVAKLHKQSDIHEGGEEIVNGCLGDIEKYLKNGKLEQVVAIIKSCTPNALGDLTLTLKDLSVKVFHKDSVPGNGHGAGGSGMLNEKEIIKLLEEEEMTDLELQVCGNVIDQ